MDSVSKRVGSSFVLAALLILLLGIVMLAPGKAQADTLTGNCGANGNNATYELDFTTGTLTISGSGAMKEFAGTEEVPWINYASYVKSLSIGSDITTLGQDAFYKCANITSVEIPASVTSIGVGTFAFCTSLTKVTIAQGSQCATIAQSAFNSCSSLTSINIPSTVTSIGMMAFIDCSSLTAKVPSTCTIGDFAFSNSAYEVRTCITKPTPTTVEYTYNGSFHQNQSYINAINSETMGMGGDNPGGTNAGTYRSTFYPKSAYMWSDGTTDSVFFTMIIKPATYNMSNVKFTGTTVTYDGQAHSIGVTGLPSGVTATASGDNQINAGTYDVTISFSGDANNYEAIASQTTTLTISPKPIAVPTAKTGLVYDGTMQHGVATGEGYVISGITGSDTAGEYDTNVDLAEGGNYVWEDGSTDRKIVSWTISPKKIAVPVAKTGLVYDGSEQVGVADGEGYVLSVDTAATDASMYEVCAELDASGNYIWEDETTEAKTIFWSIAKATYDMSGVVISGTKATYDGKAHSIAVAGLPAGVTATVEGDGKIDAGTYSVTVSFAGESANYEAIPSQTVTLFIAKAAQSKAKIATTKKTVKGCKKGKLKKAKKFTLKKSGVLGGAKVTFAKANKAGKSKITVSKTGKITMKKGLKKGTYKIKVKMAVAATTNYSAKTVTKTIKVKVK